MPANPAATQELWEVLKTFPYTTRYRVYGLWRNLAYTKYPELVRAKTLAVQEAKRVMRYTDNHFAISYDDCYYYYYYCYVHNANGSFSNSRRLTKENVKVQGRQIGKITHNNAAIVFDVVVDQLQQYESLIQPVVNSLKYCTPMSYDVLTCKCRVSLSLLNFAFCFFKKKDETTNNKILICAFFYRHSD